MPTKNENETSLITRVLILTVKKNGKDLHGFPSLTLNSGVFIEDPFQDLPRELIGQIRHSCPSFMFLLFCGIFFCFFPIPIACLLMQHS